MNKRNSSTTGSPNNYDSPVKPRLEVMADEIMNSEFDDALCQIQALTDVDLIEMHMMVRTTLAIGLVDTALANGISRVEGDALSNAFVIRTKYHSITLLYSRMLALVGATNNETIRRGICLCCGGPLHDNTATATTGMVN
jgi:hypothetical protein